MKVLKLKNTLFDLAIFILLISNLLIAERIFNYTEINNGKMEFDVLNVGQGDSILIKTPGGKYGLIDTGRFVESSKELKDSLPSGVNELDFIVLTHPDADHIGGFKYLANDYKINRVFVNDSTKQTELWNDVKKIIADKHIPNYSLFSDNDFEIDGVNFDVVWPETGTDLTSFDEVNDTSISMVITFHDFSVFTGGDLTGDNEVKALKDSHITEFDVLKVGHHGSHYSTNEELLELFKPSTALISVGAGNTYGHPADRVINDLTSNGIKYYRTDKNGRIKLTTDGYMLKISDNDSSNELKI